jgi:hypothetical protein
LRNDVVVVVGGGAVVVVGGGGGGFPTMKFPNMNSGCGSQRKKYLPSGRAGTL